MMRLGKVAVLLLVATFVFTALMAGTPTGSVGSKSKLTVGDFLVMVSSKLNTDPQSSELTPEQAAAFLGKFGVKVGSDISATLTEADAASIFRQFGITLQPGSASAALDSERAQALLGIFGDTIAAHRTDSKSFVKSSSGSTAKPLATLSLDTHTGTYLDCQELPHDCSGGSTGSCFTCHECCKRDPPTGFGLSDRVCSKLCSKAALASGVEPTP